MNLYKYLVISTLFLGSVLIIIFSQSQRKILCIQSSSIERVFFQGVETSNCLQTVSNEGNASVRFNKNYRRFEQENVKLVDLVNEKSRAMEAFFRPKREVLNKNLYKYKVHILRAPNAFNVNKNEIIISENYLQHTETLEFIILRNIISSANIELKKNSLLLDIITYFQFFLMTGEYPKTVSFFNYQPKVLWKKNEQVSREECVSSWRLSAIWDLCMNGSLQLFETSSDFFYDRLFIKTLNIFKDSYFKLSMTERYELRKNFKEKYEFYKDDKNIYKKTENSFNFYIKNLVQFWIQNTKYPQKSAEKKFVANVLGHYNQSNFYNMINQTQFDLLYINSGLNWGKLREDFKNQKIFKNFEKYNFALSNLNDIVVLPVFMKFKLNSFTNYKSNFVVWETCQKVTISDILKYEKVTDKLVLMYNCNHQNMQKFDGLLKEGVPGFAIQNPDIHFIQFHLPSLVSKKSFLNLDAEVFEYVQARNIKNSLYEVFGWMELSWDQLLKSYKPKAYVDAIGLFRI